MKLISLLNFNNQVHEEIITVLHQHWAIKYENDQLDTLEV